MLSLSVLTTLSRDEALELTSSDTHGVMYLRPDLGVSRVSSESSAPSNIGM